MKVEGIIGCVVGILMGEEIFRWDEGVWGIVVIWGVLVVSD